MPCLYLSSCTDLFPSLHVLATSLLYPQIFPPVTLMQKLKIKVLSDIEWHTNLNLTYSLFPHLLFLWTRDDLSILEQSGSYTKKWNPYLGSFPYMLDNNGSEGWETMDWASYDMDMLLQLKLALWGFLSDPWLPVPLLCTFICFSWSETVRGQVMLPYIFLDTILKDKQKKFCPPLHHLTLSNILHPFQILRCLTNQGPKEGHAGGKLYPGKGS